MGSLVCSIVLSLPQQQETGTEVAHSQGTIGFSKRGGGSEGVTIAQASNSYSAYEYLESFY